MTHARTVVALFARRDDAFQAITKLIESGISPEHIGYLEPLDEHEMKNPAKGAAEGIAVGGTSGAVIGGAATGAVAGGLLGADLGGGGELYFMEEVQSGRILVSVEVEGGESEVATLLSESGAFEVSRLGTATLHARLHHPPSKGA